MNVDFHNCFESFVKLSLFTSMFLLATIFIPGTFLVSRSFSQELETETIKIDQEEITKMADAVLTNRHCPCQCGNYLPSSRKSSACFGCSVGKAEITYVLESLKAGMKPREIIMDLNSPVLIEIFADYTDKSVLKVWQRIKKVAVELHQTRVVLRTPGLTVEARRAIRLAECARLNGKFTIIQDILIKHQGPWDRHTLIILVTKYGQNQKQIQACIDEINIDAQIAKDQQHAEERGIVVYPTITINRQVTPNTERSIRQTIERIILEGSI